MGQKHSCMREDTVQDVVNRAPDGTNPSGEAGKPMVAGNPNSNPALPRLENPLLSKEPVITQVHRRHKGKTTTRMSKQRELMVAGLQVRQQQGESIAYLLNSLPYGSIIQVESNTHLLVAQPVRRLQLSIYQNALGNVQIATVTSQEGIVPPSIGKGQILVTVNGKSVKTVDQAIELLSMPEKLLIVMAEAPLDKKNRQQVKGTTRVLDSVLTKKKNREGHRTDKTLSEEEERQRSRRHHHHHRRRHSSRRLSSSDRTNNNDNDERSVTSNSSSKSRRRRNERRGSGSSHGSHRSHSSGDSHGSDRSARRRHRRDRHHRRSSSKTTAAAEPTTEESATTPLRMGDKVIPTIPDSGSDSAGAIRRNSSSSMSSSHDPADHPANKIWVAKGGGKSMEEQEEGAAQGGGGSDSTSTHPPTDSSDDQRSYASKNHHHHHPNDSDENDKASSGPKKMNQALLLNNTMDTANTTMLSYDEEVDLAAHSPSVISPSSSVTGSANLSPAPPSSAGTTSLEDVSKMIGSFDEDVNDRPLLFQTTSQEESQYNGTSTANSSDDATMRAMAYTGRSANKASPAASNEALQGILSKLDNFLDETMMELAFVMIEMEDIQHREQQSKEPASSSSSSSEQECATMTTERLEALEKDLRHKIFDILEARQTTLQQQKQQHHHHHHSTATSNGGVGSAATIQPSLLLPTIDEGAAPPKAVLDTSTTPLPSNFSLAPSSSNGSNSSPNKMQDLEDQLKEMKQANQALQKELDQKNSQLSEWENEMQQHSVNPTTCQ